MVEISVRVGADRQLVQIARRGCEARAFGKLTVKVDRHRIVAVTYNRNMRPDAEIPIVAR